jgi:hypothetical protein
MKSAYLLINKYKFLFFILASVAISLFSSCKKDEIDGKERVVGEAKIKFINAYQGSSSVDFFLDDTKINPLALAYGESSEYIKIASGSKITKANQGAGALEGAIDFNFIPTFSYTSFFVEDKEGKGEVLTFEDNLGAVESDKSRVRFINLSPNFTNTVNISLAGGELVVTGLAFKESSGYFMVEAGKSIGVSITGSSAFKIAAGNEFEGGKNYTIWLSGTSNANLSINKITYN